MRARDDLFYAVASEIDRSLADVADAQASPPPKPEPVQPIAAPVAPVAQPATAAVIDDQAKIDVELNKWNWGAFLLSPIWGIGNGVYRALLTLVPIYGIYEWIMCGKNGNRWAWEKRDWDSIESFRKTQRKWALWGAIVDVILIFVYASIVGSSSSG